MGGGFTKVDHSSHKLTSKGSEYQNNYSQDYSSTGTHLYASLNNKIEIDKPIEYSQASGGGSGGSGGGSQSYSNTKTITIPIPFHSSSESVPDSNIIDLEKEKEMT